MAAEQQCQALQSELAKVRREYDAFRIQSFNEKATVTEERAHALQELAKYRTEAASLGERYEDAKSRLDKERDVAFDLVADLRAQLNVAKVGLPRRMPSMLRPAALIGCNGGAGGLPLRLCRRLPGGVAHSASGARPCDWRRVSLWSIRRSCRRPSRTVRTRKTLRWRSCRWVGAGRPDGAAMYAPFRPVSLLVGHVARGKLSRCGQIGQLMETLVLLLCRPHAPPWPLYVALNVTLILSSCAIISPSVSPSGRLHVTLI